MTRNEHLNLRTVRLCSPEEWAGSGDGIHFVLARAGTGRLTGDGPMHQVLSGDLLVLTGSGPGRLVAANGSELVFACFSMAIEHLVPLLVWEEIRLVANVAEAFKRPRLFAAETSIALECHHLVAGIPAQFGLEHRTQLLRVAGAVLSAEFRLMRQRREKTGPGRMADHMHEVVEGLSSEDLATLSVQQLAGRFGCTRRHLNRLFHQYFGLSVASLKMEMRLQRATVLLRDPNLKIIHVAEQCGFNHLGLFNTCFKRRFGTSPGQWRKKVGAVRHGPDVAQESDGTCMIRANGLCPWHVDGQTHPDPYGHPTTGLSKQ